jgi:serine/threonine-protein kinase
MGEVFAGRYELVDLLATGGTATVWRAWDHRERHFVAAKVARQTDSASLMRFMREQALRLDHPHLLTPIGWVGEDDRVLVAMRLVDGGSAATVVGDYGPLPDAWVGQVASQVFDGLAFLHGLGLVHRDVKPANVLLAATGIGPPQVWLGDFGLTVSVDEPRLTRAHVVWGTSGYSAPEADRGADPDPSADMYAMGMTIAELLTGQVPGRDAAVLSELRHSALYGLVHMLCADDPAARPTALDAAAMLAVLDLTHADDQVEVLRQLPAWPDGWDERGPVSEPANVPVTARRRTIAIAAGVIVTGVVTLVVAGVLALM